jgi:hypothetical protein
LEAEVEELVRKRAVELVVNQHSPGFYGRIFVVPKANGGWRPVLDLSHLNLFLRKIKFRMETPQSVRAAIRPGDWATSIDLTDAYFHVLIHRVHRKFLRFVWKERVFQFRALPFGLSLAPWLFTKVVRELCAEVREIGVRLRAYLDDWLILNQLRLSCAHNTALVLGKAERLGFTLNYDKSELVPSQRFVYLGMEFDTVAWTVRPALPRVESLLSLLEKLLRLDAASARQIASLLGTLESLAPLVHLGRLRKRPLQRAFRERWVQARDAWDCSVPLGLWFQEAVAVWLNRDWLLAGVPIMPPPPQRDLFTDASMMGWGAHMDDCSAHGVWSQTQCQWHINCLELEAVRLALLAFESKLVGRTVRVYTDNTTVASYINKQGGTVSLSLSLQAESLLLWADSRNMALLAAFVPGRLNVLADALSRSHLVVQTEWTLVHEVLEPVWRLWHKPMLDLFATRFNHRLPLYVSPVPDAQAWAVDALSLPWTGLDAYAFPPLALLPSVVRKAEIDAPRMILIAPRWSAQPWFPDLLRLSHVPPLPLAVRSGRLIQPRSGIPHGNPQMLDLHAWLLCGAGCGHRVPPSIP